MSDTFHHAPDFVKRPARQMRIRGAGRAEYTSKKTEVARFIREMLRDENSPAVEPAKARPLHAAVWAL